MAKFDVSGTASSVLGIAGMGIGIGILAHTAKNITKMSSEMYKAPRRRTYKRRSYRSKSSFRPRNYWGMR